MEQLQDNRELKVGLFGIGLETYWSQFPGLKDRLCGYTQSVAERLQRPGVQVVNLGLIDNPEKALSAGHQFRCEIVDTDSRLGRADSSRNGMHTAPAHHCAIGVGHIAAKLKKLSHVLNIEFAQVC